LNPSWEPYEGYYRIVLTGIKAEEIPLVAEKLGAAGFKEAIARIESYEVAE
jgi:NAD(P)H-nitrite reductase large subunit